TATDAAAQEDQFPQRTTREQTGTNQQMRRNSRSHAANSNTGGTPPIQTFSQPCSRPSTPADMTGPFQRTNQNRRTCCRGTNWKADGVTLVRPNGPFLRLEIIKHQFL